MAAHRGLKIPGQVTAGHLCFVNQAFPLLVHSLRAVAAVRACCGRWSPGSGPGRCSCRGLGRLLRSGLALLAPLWPGLFPGSPWDCCCAPVAAYLLTFSCPPLHATFWGRFWGLSVLCGALHGVLFGLRLSSVLRPLLYPRALLCALTFGSLSGLFPGSSVLPPRAFLSALCGAPLSGFVSGLSLGALFRPSLRTSCALIRVRSVVV